MGSMRNELRKALVSFLLIVFGSVCLLYNGVYSLIGVVLLTVGAGLVLTLKHRNDG